MSDSHFDIIVIGSGAALVQRLAATGKRIALIERDEGPTAPPSSDA